MRRKDELLCLSIILLHAILQIYRLCSGSIKKWMKSVFYCSAFPAFIILVLWNKPASIYVMFSVLTLSLCSGTLSVNYCTLIMVPCMSIVYVVPFNSAVRLALVIFAQTSRIMIEMKKNPFEHDSLFGKVSISKVCALGIVIHAFNVYFKIAGPNLGIQIVFLYVSHMALIQEICQLLQKETDSIELNLFIFWFCLNFEKISDRHIFNAILSCCQNLENILWKPRKVIVSSFTNESLAINPSPLSRFLQNKMMQKMVTADLTFIYSLKRKNYNSAYLDGLKGSFVGLMSYEPEELCRILSYILSLSKCIQKEPAESYPGVHTKDVYNLWSISFSSDNESILGSNEDFELVIRFFRWVVEQHNVNAKDFETYSLALSEFFYFLTIRIENLFEMT
jgi:hypothetical protein